MTGKLSVDELLEESEREAERYTWDGTFADYLRLVTVEPSISKLSHALVYEAILAEGVEESPEGEPVYGLFKHQIFGLESALDRVVQYFAASARRLEVRKRILLLMGPPASGKSSVVDLIKRAIEVYTRTDEGAVYAIRGCPMQEEPLHLIPQPQRQALLDHYGVYVEGDLCPRCRYVLRTDYKGKISRMPVRRVAFSEREAIGIGYYVATNPNPSDASLLVGSVDTSRLEGDRLEVAGKAFRLDGEFNVANRGMIEFVEMFKADRHLLTTLLGLAQEQLIKMERFGSLYADEVIIGHSNEGDFATFTTDQSSEALKDRIIAVQIPYNLRVTEEVEIYRKMLATSTAKTVHTAPLTLRVASTYAVLSRLEPPSRQGMSLLEKLRLYDGETVMGYDKRDLRQFHRHHASEGMAGISPRYVMNRLDAIESNTEASCITPLAVLDSLWQGIRENVSLEQTDSVRYVALVEDTVKEYNRLATQDLRKAYEESFERSANSLLESYLSNVADFVAGQGGERAPEHDMREIERTVGVTERAKVEFRREINDMVSTWSSQGWTFDYTSEARLRSAIEKRLLPDDRTLERGLTRPRFAKQRVEWARRRGAIARRLVESYHYCTQCAEDLIEYVLNILKNKTVLKTPKNEDIEWQWPLTPSFHESTPED